ncbi:hypothetical protein Glove_383g9 [Diversispora epigaea]|uniref:Uncharacterized protein n=1 Tax=Diversispora epigaea TaxID=1348612 RepID=A0A397H8Q9_9GLOM|nr:hypothetical protein Glove_383g9 [Diversispora epigaea]
MLKHEVDGIRSNVEDNNNSEQGAKLKIDIKRMMLVLIVLKIKLTKHKEAQKRAKTIVKKIDVSNKNESNFSSMLKHEVDGIRSNVEDNNNSEQGAKLKIDIKRMMLVLIVLKIKLTKHKEAQKRAKTIVKKIDVSNKNESKIE